MFVLVGYYQILHLKYQKLSYAIYFYWLNFNVSCFVLSLQKFKLNIANTVISQDNSSLMTMDTGQLLDLFTVDKEKKKEKASREQNETGKASLKSVLENLGELWEEEQYETEYNLDNFIQSLKWSVLHSVLDKIQSRTDHWRVSRKNEESKTWRLDEFICRMVTS